MMKKVLCVVLAIAMLVMASACTTAPAPEASPGDSAAVPTKAPSDANSPDSPEPAPEGEPSFTVGMASNNLDNYQSIWCSMFEDDVKALGGEVILMNGEGSVEKQLTDIEGLITQGVDVICMQTVDPDGSVPAIKACNDAGVPVIVKESDINTDTYDANISYGDVTIMGTMQAQWVENWLKENPGKKLNIGYITGALSWGIYRYKGFTQYLEERGNFDGRAKVLAYQTANWSVDEAMGVTEDWLQAYPDMNCIIAENDEMACAAISVLNAAGANFDDWLIIGVNGEQIAVDAIKDGQMDMTIFQSKHVLTSTCAEVAKKLANGEKLDEKYMDLSQSAIKTMDAGNMDQIMTEFAPDFASQG